MEVSDSDMEEYLKKIMEKLVNGVKMYEKSGEGIISDEDNIILNTATLVMLINLQARKIRLLEQECKKKQKDDLVALNLGNGAVLYVKNKG